MFRQIVARRRNRKLRDEFYGRIVALSRHPAPYSRWGVPDTLEGRLEMLALCLFLVLERLRLAGTSREALAQDLMDAFFADMDAAHRQIGMGDLKVPRRMRELATLVSCRLSAYRSAASDGKQRFAEVIAGNFKGHAGEPSVQCAHLACCALAALEAMNRQPVEALILSDIALADLVGCKE